jgi:hypothetical protein
MAEAPYFAGISEMFLSHVSASLVFHPGTMYGDSTPPKHVANRDWTNRRSRYERMCGAERDAGWLRDATSGKPIEGAVE